MAAATNAPTPPQPTAASPPRSIHRKPVPTLPLGQHDRSDSQGSSATTDVPTSDTTESATIRASPVSPVRVNFHPDNWARPSNASIEGGHIPASSAYTDGRERDYPQALHPHSPRNNAFDQTRTLTPKQPPFPDQPGPGRLLSPRFSSDLPHRSAQEKVLDPAPVPTAPELAHMRNSATLEMDDQSLTGSSRSDDPNRHSRESDTTASTQNQASTEASIETSASSVSGGFGDVYESKLEDTAEDSFADHSVPQLQYHHQPFLPRVSSLPLDSSSRDSSKSDLGEAGTAINRHLTPNSYVRRSSLPRPQSAYSGYSELGARGRSPGFGAGLPRTSSAQSRKSPETRPVSYAELLNVPYPQQAPAPITFDNSYLRNNVGSNASLLSAAKTLEMYRQNVKKTNDFSIQYSFAVFLISTAQEQGLNSDQLSRRKGGPKANPQQQDGSESSPAELIREAKSILTRLASAGYPFAQYYLADGFASGLFNKGKEDYNAAFPLFVLAAKHGHAESGYRAGLCYEFGWGCRKDPAKAVQFLRTAASKNHPGAMTRLGKACLSGDLGENRYREGVKWLKRATESADAMYNAAPYHLGVLYETGYGADIFKDESYAAELFTQAAELGHAEASFRMGDAYEHGKLNCPRDPALSVHFYTGAAERGHAAAMMGLCAWYMVGADPILEKDEEEAYEWARRSADLGFVKAQYAVGYFTEMGIGCRRDILEANVWYVKAADAGDERAKQRLAAIRAAASGGTPMDVAPPRNSKMRKNQAKDDKDCVVM
ncbi:HCP-like protein [Durotheca rogersii]|uniref:HCP-like protein n=1 Tax=Durotheca rogersii TaxID=419775 RepID=UPI00221FC08D|nr:HCP-like protein [Durotheca rogersii]KAI5866915.1 HCP-like protein [Durotheca rogersii]